MYFIPRNNAFYNYIAHTSNRRRYLATFFIVCVMSVIGFYGIYAPFTAHASLYKIELVRLQQQFAEGQQLEKGNNDLLVLIDFHKKNMREHEIEDNKRELECNNRMQYLLDSIKKFSLVLNSYGPCKEKDKKWYVKDSAAYQVVGSLENILSFLKTIKESNQMITVSHVVIAHVKDNLYQVTCDIGLVNVKNNAESSNLNKLTDFKSMLL